MIVPTADRLGGLENQSRMLAKSLAARGQLITMLTDRSDRSPAREFVDGYLLHRIPEREIGRISKMFALAHFLVKHRNQYYVMHAHGVTGFSLLAVRLARFLKIPVILKPATRGDIASICQKQNIKHKLYQRWIRSVGTFVAVSEELQKEMISCGINASRIQRIPNFVPASRYVPAGASLRAEIRGRLHVADEETVFLFLGRLVERKGAQVLLEAWKQMNSGILWIAGDGPYAAELKRLSSELRLRNVVFHGSTARPIEFYSAADVFVLPSLEEGMPAVLMEAMSCGLPCIATRIGGVTDILQDEKHGKLVSAGSAEELSEAMRILAENHDLRIRWGNQGRARVLEFFDITAVTDRYLSLYRSITGFFLNHRDPGDHRE